MASGTLARVMNYCANCGHELGVGRFCTNCGLPVAGRHPAAPAEPPQDAAPTQLGTPAQPAPAPRIGTLPPPPRFPLYADPAPAPPPPPASRRRGGLLVWAAVLLALLVVGGAAAVLALVGGSGDRSAVDPVGPSATATHASPTTSPTSSPTAPTTSPTPPGTDLTSQISHVAVPGTAPSSVDLAGHPVSFGAAHLTDGDTESAWRVAGDAEGSVVTITFDHPVTITSVGLINGYAKSYRGYHGYRLNREIAAVRWVLDDGTSVEQQLQLQPRMQTVPVTAGPTTTLRLEIGPTVASTKVGGRDYTAISEIDIRGSVG